MKRRKEKPIKIGTSCREILQRNKLILAAFCLPVILMLLAFLVMGIYPAGENQIAVIDMYHQYVPFLGELQSKLQSGGSLFLHLERCRSGAISGICWHITVPVL